MLKKDLELLVKEQKLELKENEQKIIDLQEIIDEKNETIEEYSNEIVSLKEGIIISDLDNISMQEREVLDNTISLLDGFRKGKGNLIEFNKFIDLCFERYKIIK